VEGRSPQFIGGGVAHGKRPRSHEFPLPRKIRAQGLKIALSAKQLEGNLVILDKAEFHTHKTTELREVLTKKWDLHRAVLIHGNDELDPNLALAARGIKYINFLPTIGANVYDIVNTSTLILTVKALEEMKVRLRPRSRITYPGLENNPSSGDSSIPNSITSSNSSNSSNSSVVAAATP